jgi:hypothetical protein
MRKRGDNEEEWWTIRKVVNIEKDRWITRKWRIMRNNDGL